MLVLFLDPMILFVAPWEDTSDLEQLYLIWDILNHAKRYLD